MPPRIVSVAIVLVWLGAIVWSIRTDYLPRWTADGAPPFVVELADEAVPQVAYWGLFRNGKPIGRQQTTIAYQKDDTFEMTTQMANVELNIPLPLSSIKVQIPSFRTVMRLTRRGELIRFSTTGAMKTSGGLGQLELAAEMDGVVEGSQLICTAGVGFSLPVTKEPLDPVPLSSRQVLSSMQPLARIRGLTPGRTWTMAEVDPLGQALSQASQQFLKKSLGDAFPKGGLPFGLGGSGSSNSEAKTLLARVLPDTEMLPDTKGESACYIIRYSDNNVVVGRTWVRVSDGRVMQQQAERFGETLTLIRDN